MSKRDLIFCLIVASALAFGAADRKAAHSERTDVLSIFERRTFDAINEQRRMHGLPNLIWSDKLGEVAQAHSVNMASDRFFSHVDPLRGGLTRRLNAAGVHWRMCGENIFQAEGYDDPVPVAVEGWMKSPGHRRNILDPNFNHTGVGFTLGPGRVFYVTQEFVRF